MTIENWNLPEPQHTVASDQTHTVYARPQRRRPGRRRLVGGIVGAVAGAALFATGVVVGTSVDSNELATTSASTTTTEDSMLPSTGDAAAGRGYPGSSDGSSSDGEFTLPDDGSSSDYSASTQEDATTASDEESTGVVLIETVLGYQEASAAGTGMVLTSDGLILTNNHVIEDSTEITVTVAETGETYTATVVGTDSEDDVALLQLEDASGLTTVTLDDDGDPVVGDDITAVGNAEGGGVLMAADGSVTELESSVTTSSEYTIEGETLDGMIEFQADVVSGDSGGALLDDEGEVVGMTTAASTGLATTVAYAVPIDDALAIVDQILAGDESDGVEIGYPAFLGIGLSRESSVTMPGQSSAAVDGVEVGYVYDDTAAAAAGLVAGDVITAIDGTTVTSGTELSEAISGYEPGDSVTLTWTDSAGDSQTATVTLGEGPAA